MTPNKQNSNKRANRRNQSGANLAPGILRVFPQRLETSLVYAEQFSLSSATLSSLFGTEKSFRLNDLFDPDFSGVGHQPFGFDQVKQFYKNFLVKRCDVEVTFSDPSSDGLYVCCMGKNNTDTATVVGSAISTQIEKQISWVQPLNNTGSQRVTFRHTYDLPSMVGLTKPQYEASWAQYGAAVTSTPTVVPYFTVALADPSSPSSASSVKVTIKLTYHTQFFSRTLEVGPS